QNAVGPPAYRREISPTARCLVPGRQGDEPRGRGRSEPPPRRRAAVPDRDRAIPAAPLDRRPAPPRRPPARRLGPGLRGLPELPRAERPARSAAPPGVPALPGRVRGRLGRGVPVQWLSGGS